MASGGGREEKTTSRQKIGRKKKGMLIGCQHSSLFKGTQWGVGEGAGRSRKEIDL